LVVDPERAILVPLDLCLFMVWFPSKSFEFQESVEFVLFVEK
jgi:hypothetical protein